MLKTGTFSKIIATGLRVGWVQATPNMIDALARMVFDMGGSPLPVHETIARFMLSENPRLTWLGCEGSMRRNARQSQRRSRSMLATGCSSSDPRVAFPLGRMPGTEALSQKATEGVAMFPGANFFTDRTADTTHAHRF